MIRLPSADDPAVSLILLLDGAAEMAERCLRAVAALDGSVPCETIVLLNDPEPQLERLVLSSTQGAKTIVCRANAGPGVGWNLGAAVAEAPRLATLHEDSEPDPGWLGPLCETMDASGAGAVGARLLNGDGSVQNCGWVLFADASPAALEEANAPEVVGATEPNPADMLSGAAMLLDRVAVESAGGWDERFHPAVYVDIDVSTACWVQGRQVLSVPTATVRHAGGAFDRRPGTVLTGRRLRTFLYERNRDAFLAKWGDTIRSRAAAAGDEAPPGSRRAAVAEALAHTRERAERIRSGAWERGPVPQARRPFTGIAEPVIARGDGTYAVAPEIEQALKEAERRLIEDYCRWLVEWEQGLSGRLAEMGHLLDQRNREVGDVNTHAAELQRQRDEAQLQLERVLNGRTWRLRNFLVGALARGRGR